MRLTLLGTGSPSPSLKRQSSGHLVEIGDATILLDHGPGAHHRLIEAGRRARDVTHVIFSHLHYDHCLDYPRLVLTRWDQGAGHIGELAVLGPPPIARMTGQLFGKGGVYAEDIAARIGHQASIETFAARGGIAPRHPPAPLVREIAPGDRIEMEGWTLTVGASRHVEPFLTCLCLRIETEGRSLCYSGDSGGVWPGVVEMARGCDVLVHMMHFENGTEPSEPFRLASGGHLDVAMVAREAGVKTLVLTHMTEAIDRPGKRERLLAEMAAIFSGTIIWGEDLMEVPWPER